MAISFRIREVIRQGSAPRPRGAGALRRPWRPSATFRRSRCLGVCRVSGDCAATPESGEPKSFPGRIPRWSAGSVGPAAASPSA